MGCLIYIEKYGGGGVGVYRAETKHQIRPKRLTLKQAEMTRPKRPTAETTHVRNDPRPKRPETVYGVSTQLQSSGLVAHENSTFRNLALAVSGPFMA